MAEVQLNLAAYLKQMRIRAGLTQAKAGKILGYGSAQFISNWERGLARPPVEILARIVDLYGLKRSHLIEFYIAKSRREMEKAFQVPER